MLASTFSLLNKQLITTGQSPDVLPQLHIANSLWLQKGFPVQPAFLTRLRTSFQSSVNNVDFQKDPDQARETINKWVSDKTQHKIADLFPAGSLNQNSRLVIASAIYMKAKWERMFDKNHIEQAPFYLGNGSKVMADMMTDTGFYSFMENEQFAVIEIPYASESEQDPSLAMLILLPHDVKGFESMESRWIHHNLVGWMRLMESQSVKVTIPKFKIETDLSLKETLRAMGMVMPFNSKQADFSEIDGAKDLVIDKVFHKAYIDVDKNGIEAAAATGVSIALTSVRVTTVPYHFLADHPFLFVILDRKTDSILFMGRLSNPQG